MTRMKTSNNDSILSRLENELPESKGYWMLIAIVAAYAWTIYLTYYNSRVVGLIITAVLNKLFRYGHIKLGSLSFSVLSGKVMFRDVHLITEDFSVRVQYGWLIFRWWRPYVYKELTEDLSHMETRMSLFLEGFEFHVYNKSKVYNRLDKIFKGGTDENVENSPPDSNQAKGKLKNIHWRDLIPVTKIEISSGRWIFGNYLIPYSCLLKFDKCNMLYTTKPASTVFDKFMHILKCDMENSRLMLVPSPKYNGPVQDEPPRFMGEGFVIMLSNHVDIYYYQDEPGIVQHELEQIQMADGEVLIKRTYPCIGVDIKCGKNTDFNYGPWVDRQRELIWSFFFPPDYQSLLPTKRAQPGEKRQFRSLEVKMTINAISAIDILFTKNSITQALHMNAGKGSYVEVTVPYIVEDNGYVTKVKGQLMLVDATTSMSFRSLLECETLEFDVTASYPREWNACQEWICDLTACKALVYLIYDLKQFFSDLVGDWSSKSSPDLYKFVPYTWTLSLIVKQFEILTLANENNWVDTSSQHQENAHVAFCGELFDLCVTFPFSDFVPENVPIQLIIKGEVVFCRLHLPESNTMRHAMFSMCENIRVVDREGHVTSQPFLNGNKKDWRNVTLKSNGWVDCWKTPYVFLTVTYTYYPMPVLMPVAETWVDPFSELSEDEANLSDQPATSRFSGQASGEKPKLFDPGDMKPDFIQVELEVAPSTLVLYGSLLRSLINLKENYLGECQKATDFEESLNKMKDVEASYVHIDNPDMEENKFDPRLYRPFAVTVSVTLHDIQAHLAKNCTSDDQPCPSAYVERLCFEMDKSFRETKLQLLLSPCVLLAKDGNIRESDQEHLKDGHLALSGLQVRGHAMFSLEGLPLTSETLEYGWLIEVIVGELTGKLTTPQVQNIAEFLQTFIMMVENAENKLQTPVTYRFCQHLQPQKLCYETKILQFPCPNPEDIKYEMSRFSVDFVNIFLVEPCSALNFQIHPVRIASCNLHGPSTRAGVTGMIEKVEMKQYVTGVSSKTNLHNWLEAGGFSLGPIMMEAAVALPFVQLCQIQNKFLKLHDAKTKRLWFLWNEPELLSPIHSSVYGKCGCLGGCAFFGKNKTGISFFKLKRQRDGTHVAAVPQVCKDGSDPGFGQSLLHAGKLVFETSQLALRISPIKGSAEMNGFSFTRGYMSELASPVGDEDASVTAVKVKETPTEEAGPKSTLSDTHMLVAGHRQGELRRQSKESLLMRQSSLPSADKISVFQQQYPIENRKSSRKKSRVSHSHQTSPSYSKPRSAAESDLSIYVQHQNSPANQMTPASLHRLMSKASMESEIYYTANEADDSDLESCSGTLTWERARRGPQSDEESCPSTVKKSSHFHSLKERGRRKKAQSKSQEYVSATSSVSSLTSTLSYCSATSDNDSELMDSQVDPEELIDMINLHSHMNLPIRQSPLLLSCYSQHLSHYICQDWSSSAPWNAVYLGRPHGLNSVQSEYSLSSAGHSVYSAGVAWTPHFVRVKDGFSVNVMKAKQDHKRASPTNLTSDLYNIKATLDRVHGKQMSTNQDKDSDTPADNISKTTAVIQLSGSLDILMTPLLLEALQRYVEAVTPTLSKLHPSALIDGLHSQCLDRLKQQNKLKKDKEWDENNSEESLDFINTTELRPAKKTSLQALFTLPKINICVLQASIVEEMIAFSCLSSASDLTAVSLLAVCIDGVRCQLLSNKHLCQITKEPVKEQLTRKTSVTPKTTKSGHKGKVEVHPSEPEIEKPQELTREENVGTLQISHIHVQLRRLLKYSNFSEHVLLTAIPEQCSRVLFSLEQDTSTSQPLHVPDTNINSNNFMNSSPKQRLSRAASRDKESEFLVKGLDGEVSTVLPNIGFIMCESGLEDVSFTAVRRLGYQELTDVQLIEEKLSSLDKTVTQMQEKARSKVEGMDKSAGDGQKKAETGEKSGKETASQDSSTDEPYPLSSPSANVQSSSLSSPSWDSDKSVVSSETPPGTPGQPEEPIVGDASNGKLEIKVIWFNFASPPPISIHKKVDFTRLDWNLLSTATPAIDAWLNPCDRLMTSVRNLVREYSRRLCCVMACMMIEGLECQGIHVAYKSKFNKLTPLSKTLQEDPSNQLLTVLRKYLNKYGIEPVEKAVCAETVPQLITVQKGILALMRQWKNVLYMPNLSEINFKSRKNLRPYNVSFALPKSERDEDAPEEEEVTYDQFDVVDEKTSLLLAEGGITQRSGSFQSVNSKGRQSSSTQGKVDRTDGGDLTSADFAPTGKQRMMAMFRARKPIATTDSPIEYSSSTLAPPMAAIPLNRNDSNVSFTSLVDSVSSNEQLLVSTPPHTPLRTTGPKPSILKNRYKENEDLYQWMAKQQNEFRLDLEGDDSHQFLRHNTGESCPAGIASSWTQDDSKLDVNEDNCTMATSIMQLADAQILFKPILQSLGLHVESVRPSAMMKKFGGHLLLQCHINLFKILIAESEGTPTVHREHVPKGKGHGKRTMHKTPENPAFLCECFDMKVSLKDAIMEVSGAGDPTKPPYKFAMHKLEAKPTTLKINLLVNCQSIRQNVDMALLRLAHQVITMVSNVKQTRVELKQKKVDQPGWIQTHRKQDSKDSTSSMETNQSDTSQTERSTMGSLTNLAAVDKQNESQASKYTVEASSSLAPVNSRVDLKLMAAGKLSPQVASKFPHLQAAQVPPQKAGDPFPKQASPSESQRATAPEHKAHHQDTKRPEALAVENSKKPAHLRFLQDTKEHSSAFKKVSSPHTESDVMTPPHSLNLSDSVVLDMADTSSPALNEKTIIDEIKESTPQCWRHLYQLLELYATMPEPKTVAMRHSQAVSKLPAIEEEDCEETAGKRESRVSDYGNKLTTLIQKSSVLHGLRRESESQDSNLRWKGKEKIYSPETTESKAADQKQKVDSLAKEEESLGNDSSLAHQSFIRTRFKQSIYVGESIPVIVYGILRVETFLISAELSGLKLEAHTSRVHASGTYKKKVKGFLHRVSSDSSYTAHIGQSKINLREGEPPELQTVVTINIHKSQALLTTVMRRGKEHNSTLVSIGVVEIDIPQHPVILHDMMSRSSKRITATLQELRWPAQSTNRMQHSSEDNSNQSAANADGASSKLPHQKTPHVGLEKNAPEGSRAKHKHLHIKAVLQGFVIGASILPSLKAQYKTTAIVLTGVLGRKAHFTLTLPNHLLSFKSKITAAASIADTPIPSAASIDLPPIQVIADYRMQKPGMLDLEHQVELGEDLQLLEGNYLYAVAEVGMLEHSLTTDLLNHLVFVQKVFMKEINEIVQKVSGSNSIKIEDIKTNLQSEVTTETTPLLYSVSVRFKGIQVTATTPTSNAVRFETGAITLDLSNRFHLPKKDDNTNAKTTQTQDNNLTSQKMFIQAIVDLNLALGQLLKNPVYEETEPEFHTMAFFKTTIKIRNALQHEMIPNFAADQEALLINLFRPIILAQPLAFDKAVLVWLNYKNAYEYWTEQRMALNKEVLTATRQVIDKLPHIAPTAAPSVTTLFLQLTVDDMGICVPLLSSPYQPMANTGATSLQSPRVAETEQGSALVLTVENTQISACSSGSLVSKGKFKNFCLRFADDFGSSWDDWKPWPTDSGPVMNQCNVPSGTYEVCSRTINKQDTASGNAKWILNVQWDMKGIGVHLDTDIGKRFTLLGYTLTLLAGETDEEGINIAHTSKHGDDIDGEFDENDDEDADLSSPDTQENSLEDLQLKRRTSLASDILPEEIFSDTFDPKERARKIEREMNEQAKIVQELKECGATEATIEIERKKLEDLQTLLFQDFRRDFLEMLKRKGDRASLIKGKLGLSSKPSSHLRTKPGGVRRLAKSSSERHSAAAAADLYKSRRQSEDLSKITKVSFSGSHLNTYTPPNTPGHFSLSDDEDDDSDPFYSNRKGVYSLEAIQSSGSDSQPEEGIPHKRKLKSEDSASLTSNKVGEQNIDFELDVKVFIDSGKCVLYSKEAKEEEVRKFAKKEKQGATDSNVQLSPSAKRKLKKETSGSGFSSQRKLSANPDTTIFFIPSVAVKIHYNSRTDHTGYVCNSSTIYEDLETSIRSNRSHSFIPEITITSPLTQQMLKEESNLSLDSGSPRRSNQQKKASLYALFTLQTLPEEMIISPTLLDFLEQALEPLPITANSSPSILKRDVMDSLVNNMDLDASQGSLGQQSVAFFPVDVVVHIKVDPSFIRFNCHPVSRVECLLQVPSLDLFFSTKKTDLNEGLSPDNSQTFKSASQSDKKAKPTSSSNANSQTPGRSRHISGISETSFYPGSSSGGLSVTGCMSDFSLYIFHPYGTGVQRRFPTNTDSPTFRNQGGLERISENTGSAFHDMGRRDSLSLNVEFIKVNISRTRKLERYSEPNENAAKGEQQFRSNIVRFSAICDVGTASFKYDMRRLSEILSLPKAWYRRTLARRLFLGDESINLAQGEDFDIHSSLPSDQPRHLLFTTQNSVSHPSLNVINAPKPLAKHHRRGSSGDKIRIQLSPEFKTEIAKRRGPNRYHGNLSNRDSSHRKRSRTVSSPDVPHHRHSFTGPNSTAPASTNVSSSWETLVLFAVNLAQLNLEVNMANVMGNTEWRTKALKTQGRLSINSKGHKNLNIDAGFGKSSFESKGGIVGGTIEINNLNGFFSVCEDPELGQDPDHQAGLSTSALETKLDYMGSSIIMTRLSNLQLILKDEWHVDSNSNLDTPLATNRSAFLFVNGKLSWSHFHLMISRSTTPDLIKIISKLDEFFTQQVMSGRRVFQHTAPLVGGNPSKVARKISDNAVMEELRHHRHWQGALEHLMGYQFSMLPSVLPAEGMVLGGTMILEGQGLMLASFHGVNFRAKYWALFNIKDPYIYFSTEAQKIPEGGTHIVQDLQFIVGQQQGAQAMAPQVIHNHMATICKISRTQHMPPNFTCVDDWFTYAMTSSATDPKVVTEFPGVRHDDETVRKFSKAKATYYSHETEVIFAFPSMYMNLKTSHFQGENPPEENESRPVVECSFVAEFYDHIYVAMDAEVILFLHDLVSSYIREKDRGSSGRSSATKVVKSEPKLSDPTSALKHDYRTFECKTWQLEPTLRLIHWASTQIDPVGADYVLQKLGFSHARVTIPKWVQRGFMDPLDKVLSILVDKLVTALRDQQSSGAADEATEKD